MSLSFFDFQNNSIRAKRARRRAFASRIMIRAFAANVANTETVSATVNGGSAVTYMIDSGATYTILAETTAQQIGFDTSNPSRQQAITSVTGQTQANAFNVTMKINDTPEFQTEILVMPSSFNLLSTEDLAKAYRVTLDVGGTGFHLIPLGHSQSIMLHLKFILDRPIGHIQSTNPMMATKLTIRLIVKTIDRLLLQAVRTIRVHILRNK